MKRIRFIWAIDLWRSMDRNSDPCMSGRSDLHMKSGPSSGQPIDACMHLGYKLNFVWMCRSGPWIQLKPWDLKLSWNLSFPLSSWIMVQYIKATRTDRARVPNFQALTQKGAWGVHGNNMHTFAVGPTVRAISDRDTGLKRSEWALPFFKIWCRSHHSNPSSGPEVLWFYKTLFFF